MEKKIISSIDRELIKGGEDLHSPLSKKTGSRCAAGMWSDSRAPVLANKMAHAAARGTSQLKKQRRACGSFLKPPNSLAEP